MCHTNNIIATTFNYANVTNKIHYNLTISIILYSSCWEKHYIPNCMKLSELESALYNSHSSLNTHSLMLFNVCIKERI